MRPQNHHNYPDYCQLYIDYTNGDSVADLINNHELEILSFYNNLPPEKADFAYAENKWTVKEVLRHVIDTERVFVYRAVSFSRKDKNSLPGFDENYWAQNAFASAISLNDLQKEFSLLHQSTTLFLRSLNNAQLEETGFANNKIISVNVLAFIIFGHLLHHSKILQQRYFV